VALGMRFVEKIGLGTGIWAKFGMGNGIFTPSPHPFRTHRKGDCETLYSCKTLISI